MRPHEYRTQAGHGVGNGPRFWPIGCLALHLVAAIGCGTKACSAGCGRVIRTSKQPASSDAKQLTKEQQTSSMPMPGQVNNYSTTEANDRQSQPGQQR